MILAIRVESIFEHSQTHSTPEGRLATFLLFLIFGTAERTPFAQKSYVRKNPSGIILHLLDGEGDERRLQERMKFRLNVSYKPPSVQRWDDRRVVDVVESWSLQDMQQDEEMTELFLGALHEFVRQTFVAQPTAAGMRQRIGEHAPERLPPMTAEQNTEQEAAFDRTMNQVVQVVAQ